ncbi:MAG: DNA primase [Vicinamibacterales bacterium]|nr:DNA primase [Vicinamibacterales bacterium]
MSLFPQSFIDEVRSAANIVAVVQDYVSLRKSGTSYKGLCPFHSEKSPSFHVNPDRGFFHCFGCGVGGDVFKFMELVEKSGFQDSVRQLAQRFGVAIPEPEAGEGRREDASEREALLTIHEVAAAWFQEQLASPAGARIRDYLHGPRGLTEETITALGLGWAPPGRDALRQRLQKQGFATGMLVRSGLVVSRDDGSLIDRFRNRLMIPIARDTGSIVAFGGRALEADQQPKYLNSPETPIYTKSRMLYGLNLTKAGLRKAAFVVIVEGYFDFALVYQAGGLPVVATCGTALTPQQVQLLRRFASKAVISFDPDTAGQAAAERSCELLVSEGFDVNVALLPDGLDPDTFIQKEGRDGYVARLRDSKPYLEFLLDRAAGEFDLGRDDSRRAYLQKMLGVAARIPDPAVRDQFADRLAHKARVTESVIRDEIRKAAAARKTTLPTERMPGLHGKLRAAEKGLLWALVHDPAAMAEWLEMLEPEDLEGLRSRDILVLAQQMVRQPDIELPSVLMERLSNTEAQLLAAVAAEAHPPVRDAEQCVRALKLLRYEREQADVQREIARLQERGSAEGLPLETLWERKRALMQRISALRAN